MTTSSSDHQSVANGNKVEIMTGKRKAVNDHAEQHLRHRKKFGKSMKE
jgi:hypothetical protein